MSEAVQIFCLGFQQLDPTIGNCRNDRESYRIGLLESQTQHFTTSDRILSDIIGVLQDPTGLFQPGYPRSTMSHREILWEVVWIQQPSLKNQQSLETTAYDDLPSGGFMGSCGKMTIVHKSVIVRNHSIPGIHGNVRESNDHCSKISNRWLLYHPTVSHTEILWELAVPNSHCLQLVTI